MAGSAVSCANLMDPMARRKQALETQGAGLAALKNLGDQSVAWLTEAGFASRDDLEEAGPAEAYRRVRDRHPERATKNLLYAIAGALLDLDVSELPGDLKQHLLFEVEAADRKAGGGGGEGPPAP